MEQKTERAWYDKKSLVVLWLILFFPLGIYGLWKNGRFSKNSKGIITGVIAFCCLVGFLGNNDDAGQSTSRGEANFSLAFEGDYWVIGDENISVLREPKASGNKAQFLRNLVTVISPGTKVEVLEGWT